MKLFWFTNEEGHLWEVILAHTEESAWKILAANSYGETGVGGTEPGITLEEAKSTYEIDGVTELTQEGCVATIFPLECNFTIQKKPE